MVIKGKNYQRCSNHPLIEGGNQRKELSKVVNAATDRAGNQRKEQSKVVNAPTDRGGNQRSNTSKDVFDPLPFPLTKNGNLQSNV